MLSYTIHELLTAYLDAGHVADWTVRLYCLEVIQAPIKIIQYFDSVRFVPDVCTSHQHIVKHWFVTRISQL